MSDLNARLLAAHAAGDTSALVGFYRAAATQVIDEDVDAACFYLTHAYIFALELGDPACDALRAQLAAHGREPADQPAFRPA